MFLEEGEYKIQGLPVLELCEKYGTPLYVYDAEKVLSQVNNLKNAFQGINLKLKYAAKALTNQAILKLIKKSGIGLDVVSIQEARLGLMAGFEPKDIMFTPNCTPFAEIEQAVALGLSVNIDNIPFLERFGQVYGNTYPCCIRINPHVEAGGNDKIKTGHAESKFGISIIQKTEIKTIVDKYDIQINGVHVHTGSDFGDIEVFMQVAALIFEVAKDYSNLDFIDFGSGFKVAYKNGDKTTDIAKLGVEMVKATQDFIQDYGRNVDICFEPGKFIVSDAGTLFAHVNVVKKTPAATFAGINTGLNHLIRPMMYGAYHDIVNVSNTQGSKSAYAVVGYICETDTFGWDMHLNEVSEGDILAIKNAGAYGFSMSSNYNSRYKPAEVLVYNGIAHLIRKRETMEDLLRNQIEIEI